MSTSARQLRVLIALGAAVAVRNATSPADTITFSPACDFTWQTCCFCEPNTQCVNWDVPQAGGSNCPPLPTALDDVVIDGFCQVDQFSDTDAIAQSITQQGGAFHLDGNLAIRTHATFGGLLWWIGGGISRTSAAGATININADMLLADAFPKHLGADGAHPGGMTLVNRSTIDWRGGGGLTLGRDEAGTSPSRLINEVNGTIKLESDASIWDTPQGGGVLTNIGVIRKTAGEGASEWHVHLVNHGLVHVRSGELHLLGDGSHAGRFQISSGARLVFAPGAPMVFLPGSQITGSGEVAVLGDGGDAIHLETALELNRLSVENLGAIVGASAAAQTEVTVNDELILSAADIAVPLHLRDSATAAVFGPGPSAIGSLVNDGTLELFNDGALLMTGGGAAPLVNNGIMRKLTNDAPSALSSETGGTLRHNPGAIFDVLVGEVQIDFDVVSGGDIHIGNDAVLACTGTIELTDGLVSGSGRIVADVVNNGATIAPGAPLRMITIAKDQAGSGGNYSQGPAGKLVVEVGGADRANLYDRLVVEGTVALDGTLEIIVRDGFVPSAGELIGVVWAEAISGQFSSITAPQLPAGLEPTVQYSDRTVTVTFGQSSFVTPEDRASESETDGSNDEDDSQGAELIADGACGACGNGGTGVMPVALLALAMSRRRRPRVNHRPPRKHGLPM